MTRELILGSLLSAALHFLLLGPDWRPAKPGKVTAGDAVTTVRWMPMPPIEDEPEIVPTDHTEREPLDMAPPMQPDVVELARPDVFVQKYQLPPPDGPTFSTAMTVIPSVRESSLWKKIEVFDRSQLDHQPVPKFQARPQYPSDMRHAGIPGEVVVDFIVDTNGDVQNAYALRSSQREFEVAAVSAVSRWRFRPGRKSGRDVPTHLQVPVVFTLNEQ
jgi:protein TonB